MISIIWDGHEAALIASALQHRRMRMGGTACMGMRQCFQVYPGNQGWYAFCSLSRRPPVFEGRLILRSLPSRVPRGGRPPSLTPLTSTQF